LAEHLATPRTLYCGFDPSADSLHIGSLVPLLTLRRFQAAGHTPIVLLGGATGMIGDPSFKASERKLLDEATLAHNVAGIGQHVQQIFTQVPEVVNNYSWTKGVDVLSFLRDIGKHFSINQMISRESVKNRLAREGEGLSFTEFSYALLQGFDFYELAKSHECTLQIGGSDQWGNMTAGTELIRKKLQREAHVLTLPLVTKADGTKFGKTESGTIWLDPAKTSPYAFYQFWLNTADADVEKFLGYFSFRPLSEIKALMQTHQQNMSLRFAQTILAKELTTLLHGEAATAAAEAISTALFDGTVDTLAATDFAQLATGGVPAAVLNQPANIVDALVIAELATSKREAREFIASGAVQHNGGVVKDEALALTPQNAKFGRYHLLKRGKKQFALLVHAA
jgi:tyrosyl-tRNA synthetase